MKRKIYLAILGFSIPLFGFALTFENDLEPGTKNEEVKRLQEYLSKDSAIYPEKLITGYYGPKTKAAVKRLQERERMFPATGILGPKTRAKINQSASTSGSVEDLMERIRILQKALADLQAASAATSSAAAATTIAPADTTSPEFTEGPSAEVTYKSDSPFGNGAPYNVVISWKTDESSALAALSCSPQLASAGLGLQATYWAKTGGKHTCTLEVEDSSHNMKAKDFSFEVPVWGEISGSSVTPLAESVKLGEMAFTNHGTTSAMFFRMTFEVTDTLDAPNSRGKSFKLVLRNGTTTNDSIIKTVSVPVHSTYPGLGKSNISNVSIYAGSSVPAGETKTYGFWIEALTWPFYGGGINLRAKEVLTLPEYPVYGSASFTLGVQ